MDSIMWLSRYRAVETSIPGVCRDVSATGQNNSDRLTDFILKVADRKIAKFAIGWLPAGSVTLGIECPCNHSFLTNTNTMKKLSNRLLDKLLESPWIDIFIILMLILTAIFIWGLVTIIIYGFYPL